MSLSIGIVGLPNVGKSTLFNALLKRQQAYVANFPFATIEPNVGIVPVPDPRLAKLAEVVAGEFAGPVGSPSRPTSSGEPAGARRDTLRSRHPLPPIVPATVEVVDIAGLVKDAYKGEGLGNKFLSHIREVDAIAHVLRVFKDPSADSGQAPIVREGSIDPKSDFEIVKTELDLADLESIERRDAKKKIDEALPLFGNKPILIILNVDETDLINTNSLEEKYAKELGLEKDQVTAICAKTESELAELSEKDQKEYLANLGVEKSGLEKLIQKMFSTLGLITFLTAGEKEVRAWTIEKGTNAQAAAGVIHTDFIKGFIKAEVVDFDDFVACGGWKGSREAGKARLEGKDYIVQDGDVIEFKVAA